MVAVLPGTTEAVTDAEVDGVPPLIVTEHHWVKFRTVSVTLPPPSPPPSATLLSVPPSAGVLPESVTPLELPLDEPELDPLLEPDPLPELDPPPELLPPSDGVTGAGDELLLHATAPATATSAPMLATLSQRIWFIVLITATP